MDDLHDPRGLARAISRVVAGGAAARAVLGSLGGGHGRARVVGVTGAAGAGKSTLVDALARWYREVGETVGVVAVDPSSPFTGGAILGDRIRMQGQAGDPGVFIRSLATRGALGGLAAATHGVVRVLEAAGKQRILIETVGVGQDEVEIAQLADVTVVVLVPGMGDSVQTLKAGLMEIADVFVLNKADHGAEALERDLKAALALALEAGRPPIVKTVATSGEGIAELAQAVDVSLDGFATTAGGVARRRAAQWERRLSQLARERLAERVLAPLLTPERLRAMAEAAAAGADPDAAIEALIAEALAAIPL